jgi:hypothetical protein
VNDILLELAAVDAGGITKNKTQTKAQVHHVRVCCCGRKRSVGWTGWGELLQRQRLTATPRTKSFIQRMRPVCIHTRWRAVHIDTTLAAHSFPIFLLPASISIQLGGDVIRISVGNCRPHEVVNNGKTRDRVL